MEDSYRRMPAFLDWYFREMRKTPNTWMTTPIGIMVPKVLWDSDLWMQDSCAPVRAHEETHLKRMQARGKLSQWTWVLRYLVNSKMAYEEEIAAFRVELTFYPSGEARNNHANWCADTLIRDYGFKKPASVILRDLLSFL